MKKLNNNGFSLLHILLLIVIVGLIGGTGYYVYNSQKETNKNLDNAAKSQTDPQKSEENAVDDSSSSKAQTDPNTGYVEIKDWEISISQPEGHTIAVSEQLGGDFIKGALGTVYVYIPKYDENYTCDSNQGETHKAKILTIQRFSKDSGIESNTKNKPDVVKKVGDFKYGVYKPISNCYDSSTTSTIQSIIESYLKDLTIN